MSKAKMLAAKELIQEKRYDEARKILQGIDHPTAYEWLEKLDKIAPAKRRLSSLVVASIGLLALALLALVVVFLLHVPQSSSIALLPSNTHTLTVIPEPTTPVATSTDIPEPSQIPTFTVVPPTAVPSTTATPTVTPSSTITRTLIPRPTSTPEQGTFNSPAQVGMTMFHSETLLSVNTGALLKRTMQATLLDVRRGNDAVCVKDFETTS